MKSGLTVMVTFGRTGYAFALSKRGVRLALFYVAIAIYREDWEWRYMVTKTCLRQFLETVHMDVDEEIRKVHSRFANKAVKPEKEKPSGRTSN